MDFSTPGKARSPQAVADVRLSGKRALYSKQRPEQPTSIYNRSETAPIRRNGLGWDYDHAFTLVEIDPLEMSATERMVILTSPNEANSCWWKAAEQIPGLIRAGQPKDRYTQEIGGVRNVFVCDRVSKRKLCFPSPIDAYSDGAVDWERTFRGDARTLDPAGYWQARALGFSGACDALPEAGENA